MDPGMAPTCEPAREPIPGPPENVCAEDKTDFGDHRAVPGQEHTRLARLREETPELSDSIRECDLLSLALMAHAQTSACINGQIDEDAEAIGRGAPLFPAVQPPYDS